MNSIKGGGVSKKKKWCENQNIGALVRVAPQGQAVCTLLSASDFLRKGINSHAISQRSPSCMTTRMVATYRYSHGRKIPLLYYHGSGGTLPVLTREEGGGEGGLLPAPPPTHPMGALVRVAPEGQAVDWPLQDIRLARGLHTKINTIVRKHLLVCAPHPPTSSPTLLRNTVSPPDHPVLQYTPYNIGNGNIV